LFPDLTSVGEQYPKSRRESRQGQFHYAQGLSHLEKQGLARSQAAEPTTLIRSLTLDLLGLPPSPAEIDAFVGDNSPDAYLVLENRLRASPYYGMRMAMDWFDAARYADANSFQNDLARTMWP
jgi:hypothetical protein